MNKKASKYHTMNWFQKAMLVCSGANLHILQKTPSEWNKFSGIGGVILFTSIFATLSASYALHTVFDNSLISIPFGILWGLMIFNLDRYIVSSIKKSGTWGNQVLMAIPRLILATFLGIIISKPLELKIFEKEVNKQLNTIIQRNKSQLEAEMNTRILKQSNPFDKEKKEINDKINELQISYDSASSELEKEIIGTKTNLTSGKTGYGTNAKRKEILKEQRRIDLENYKQKVNPRLLYLDQEISKVYETIENERKKTETTEEKFNGFAARLQALDELGNNSSVIAVASIFIMGLFICLEISPVIVKLISSVGPYDYLLEKTEHDFRLYAKEKIEKGNISTEQRIHDFRKNKS